MEVIKTALYHPLKPGIVLQDDWYKGEIPLNMEVGENTVIDSSFCFKHFFSALPIGIKIGSNVTIWRASLAAEENGYLQIGDYSYITNAAIVCSKEIIIGNGVFIAGGVTIADSDFHPLEPAARLADTIALSPKGNRKNRPLISAQSVIIEDDVWIGYNATILKGVRVGAGAIISPGSLVISDVAAGSTVTGNPAKSVSAAI